MFAFHAGALPGGFIGVDVFFVISGFLITGLALTEMEATGRLGLGAFWARRARRLLPPLLALIATIVAVVAASGVPRPGLPRDVVAALTYVANWTRISDDHQYFAAYEEPSLLEHTWSLAVEEQFYVIWPLVLAAVLWAVGRRGGRLRPTVLVVSVTVAVASTAWTWWLAGSGRAPLNRLYFGTDTRAMGLAVGCALACLLARGERTADRRVGPSATVAAVAAAATLVGLTLVLDGGETWLYGPGFAVVAVASAALVTAASGRGIVARALATGPLPAVGRVSYGIYLWHWPIIVAFDRERTGLSGPATGALWITATAAATALSWWLIERRAPLPGLNRPGVAASYVAVAAVLALVSVTALDPRRSPLDPDLFAADSIAADTIAADSVDTPVPDAISDAAAPDTRPAPTVADRGAAAEVRAATDSDGIGPGDRPPALAGDTARDDRPPHASDETARDDRPPHASDETARDDRPPHASDDSPADDGVLDVLVLGDSVAESLGPGPPRPLVVGSRPVRAVNHGIVACPIHPEGRWRYDDGRTADDPPACEGPDRFDAVVDRSEPDLIVLMFGWPGTIASRELDDGTVVTACDDEHDRRWVAGHLDLVQRYADVAPVVTATIAPPQTFLDPEQQDRPGCLDRALRSSGVPIVEWGEWLCPGGDCTRAAALRRDPVHFGDDDEVLDVLWRRLVTTAADAAGA